MLRDQPFMRDDTFLGVCHAIAEDFHIPANLLRAAIAPVLVWNPVLTLTVYVAAALLIAMTRWIFPNPAQAQAAPAAAQAVEPADQPQAQAPLAEAA